MNAARVKSGWWIGLVVALGGCPSSGGGSGDTDTDTDTDGATGTTMPATTMPPPNSSSTAPTTGAESTTGDESTTGETTTTGGTTGDPPPTGVCLGIDEVGAVAEVSGLDGANVDPACDPEPVGCEGSIEGEWTVVASCGFEDFLHNFFDDECPGAEMTVENATVTGTRTFNGDATFDWDVTTDLSINLLIDAMTCFGVDCAGLQDGINGEENGLTGTCVDAGDGTCDCDLASSTTDQFSGTYAVDGTEVTMSTDEDEETLEFCVEGDRLELWTPIYDAVVYDEECDSDQDCAAALGDMSEFYVCVPDEEE